MTNEMNITIPAYLPDITEEEEKEIERLMFLFGGVRRKCYSRRSKAKLNNREPDRLEIRKDVKKDVGLLSWYVNTAYRMIESLPVAGVTFGGKKAKHRLERSKISLEEWRKKRNNIIASDGDKYNEGNRNIRVKEKDGQLKLRLSTDAYEWIWLDLYIPRKYLEKYGHLLDGSKPYRVLIKRRDDNEYDVKITVHPEVNVENKNKLMTLDVNSGHIDWAVIEKGNMSLIETGRVNCYEVIDSPSDKSENIIHRVANKIGNIANHFDADVVMGSLNTGGFNSYSSQANRRVKGMSQFKLKKVLSYKLPLKGISFETRSEAYTSMIGEKLGDCLGLDTHKGSAYAFAIKVVDYNFFKLLKDSLTDEGDVYRSREDFRKSGLTACIQFLANHGDDRLNINEPRGETTPQSMVGVAPVGVLQPKHTEAKV